MTGMADYAINPDAAQSYADAVVDTHGFPVLRDAVKQRLSLTDDEAQRLIEEWRAHSCLTWLLSREPQSEPPPTLAGLKLYAMRGIPDEYRPESWRRICEEMHGCGAVESEYTRLLDMHADEVTVATQEIDRDVDRTFPSNLAFMSTCRDELRRVLSAIAYRVPRIGYCQGMNFIAGMLLLLLEEEDAYWAMLTFVDKLVPAYFVRDLIGNRTDERVLESLLKKHLPVVAEAMQSMGVSVAMLSNQWFLSFFVNYLPTETVLRVWDLFFIDGRLALFRVALAIFLMAKEEILQCSSPESMIACINKVAVSIFDADSLMAAAYGNFGTLGREEVDSLTTEHLEVLANDSTDVKCVRPEVAELFQLVRMELPVIKVAMEIAAGAAAEHSTGPTLELPTQQLLDIIQGIVSEPMTAKRVFSMVCPPMRPGQQTIPVSCLAGLILLSTGKLEQKVGLLWDTFTIFGAAAVDVAAVGLRVQHMLHCWYLRPPSAETISAQVASTFKNNNVKGNITRKDIFTECTSNVVLLADCLCFNQQPNGGGNTTAAEAPQSRSMSPVRGRRPSAESAMLRRGMAGASTAKNSRREREERRRQRMEAERNILADHRTQKALQGALGQKANRDVGWNDVFKNGYSSIHKDALKKLVLNGMPKSLRIKAWHHMVVRRQQLGCQSVTYEKVVEFLQHHPEQAPFLPQLEEDVPEEGPEACLCKGAAQLRQILTAFAFLQPHIGYCSGMHIMLAQMLVFLRESDAFWIFFHAVGTGVFPALHVSSAMPAIIGSATFDLVLLKAPIAVRQHIVALGAEAKQSLAELFAQWLRHVYVGVFPTDTLARIWDCALMVGPKILLRVACLVVLCAAKDLLAATNASQLVQALRKAAAEWSSPQALVDRAYSNEVGAVPTQLMARLQMQYARSSFVHNLHNMFDPVFEKESDSGSKVRLVAAANGLQVWRTGTATNWVTIWDNSSGDEACSVAHPIPAARVVVLCDTGTEVWMGCSTGVIERCNYDGSAQSRLSHHIAEVKFIATRTSPRGVLSGSSDGALVYWQTQPFHVSAFGISPESNRFICNHKIWDCAVDIPCTGLMWLGGESGLVSLDPIKQTSVSTIGLGCAVTALCRVGCVGCQPDSLWAVCKDTISVQLLGNSSAPVDSAMIGPLPSTINCIAWSGDSEVWAGCADGSVFSLCPATHTVLSNFTQHPCAISSIVHAKYTTAALTLAWVASDDGMLTVWVSSRWPEDTILAQQGGTTIEVSASLESEEDGAAVRMQRQVANFVGGVTGDMLKAGSKAFRPALGNR